MGKEMSEISLKRCPFCGGTAKIGTKTFDLFNVAAYAYCSRCKARTDLIEADVNISAVKRASELWNARVEEKENELEAEEIEAGRRWGE